MNTPKTWSAAELSNCFKRYQALSTGPVVVAVSVALPEESMGWLQAEESYLFHGDTLLVGSIFEWTTQGPQRFEDARMACSLVQCVGEVHLPTFGCAFTFDDAQCRVFVPRVVIRGQKAQLHVRLEPGVDLEPIIAHTLEQIHALQYVPVSQPSSYTLTALPNANAERYPSSVQAALKDIQKGHYTKIVLAQQTDYAVQGKLDVPQIIRQLKSRFPAALPFAYQDASGTLWIGATPEALFELNAEVLYLQALAGTASEPSQLLNSAKLLDEHACVIQCIQKSMTNLGLKLSDEALQPSAVPYGSLYHLETRLSIPVKEALHPLKIIQQLHPTAAVGGLPKPDTTQRIAALEGLDREFYAGGFGWWDAHQSHITVNIRCARLRGAVLSLFAGCGITQGSDPATEYAEACAKHQTLLPCFTC